MKRRQHSGQHLGRKRQRCLPVADLDSDRKPFPDFGTKLVPQAAIAPTFPSSYRQRPQLEVEPGSDFGQQPLYFTDTVNPPGQAVVSEQSGARVRLLLVGIAPGQVNPGSQLRGPNQGDRVEITQRNGLLAEGCVRG